MSTEKHGEAVDGGFGACFRSFEATGTFVLFAMSSLFLSGMQMGWLVDSCLQLIRERPRNHRGLSSDGLELLSQRQPLPASGLANIPAGHQAGTQDLSEVMAEEGQTDAELRHGQSPMQGVFQKLMDVHMRKSCVWT